MGLICRLAPMDLALAIAQGFHNAPRLYGDTSVRTAPRISGIQSGLRAAGSEFVFGMYDGVTGLFLQPYHGVRDNGAIGLVQGIGKGIGGFVLKDIAAIIGPFGYSLKGVHKELIKSRQPTSFIRDARIIQGGKDVRALDGMAKERESAKVDAAWRIVSEIRRENEARKEAGFKGRMVVLKEKRKTTHMGAYESVGQAKKSLEVMQEERRMRESASVGGTGGEEGGGMRLFGMKESLLHLRPTKHAEDKHGTGMTGADRNVPRELSIWKKEPAVSNGHEEQLGAGLVNGTMGVTA